MKAIVFAHRLHRIDDPGRTTVLLGVRRAKNTVSALVHTRKSMYLYYNTRIHVYIYIYIYTSVTVFYYVFTAEVVFPFAVCTCAKKYIRRAKAYNV
jgi:hypothetical protein